MRDDASSSAMVVARRDCRTRPEVHRLIQLDIGGAQATPTVPALICGVKDVASGRRSHGA